MTSADSSGASVIGGLSGADMSKYYNFSYDEATQAAVDAVNGMGGIAGRKIEPVVYSYNIANFTSASGRQQEAQRACALWTEDKPVFAFDGSAGTESITAECAAKSKTPWIPTGYHLALSQRHFDSMSNYFYSPRSFIADRRERAMAKFLLAHGFIPKGAKVALLIEDKPDTREGVERGMKPVLEAAGIKPLEIVFPDFISSPWANYVLQLKTAGVTHVVWANISAPALSAVLMMRAAQDQQYRPKWAMGSDMQGASMVATGAPEEQMANTSGMGWQYAFDTGDDTKPQSDHARICSEALKKRGQPPGNAAGQGRCEFLMFLRSALALAPEVSPAGLAAGVAKLAGTFGSTATIGGATNFGPGRHDGVSAVRPFAYDPGKKQFQYTGGPEPVPS